MQLITWIDILAIVLSIVSLILSVVAFFASLKFYRDGVQLQQKANDALTKIEEKTAFIQGQVGGMFDKTLEAAIGKREVVAANFEELKIQVDEAHRALVQEAAKEVGAIGEQERKRLESVVDSQIEKIRQKVEEARESASELAEAAFDSEAALRILKMLKGNKPGQYLMSLRISTLLPEDVIKRKVPELYRLGYITETDGMYSITAKGEKELEKYTKLYFREK